MQIGKQQGKRWQIGADVGNFIVQLALAVPHFKDTLSVCHIGCMPNGWPKFLLRNLMDAETK